MNNAERNKKYYAEHCEEIKAHRREYYQNNKEKELSANRERRKAHPEYSRKYAKEYYANNKDDPEFKRKQAENHAKWRKENREKWNAYRREYYRKKKEALTTNGNNI